ncbi:MAG TPA: single-stranded-DNA-specific exonuclease RecJ, partial [Miltoncostaeaceae bacterium]|nr:single-stranded-DNA-specific exonuclease RecJ [Miltoncostaeaceae bacterium]
MSWRAPRVAFAEVVALQAALDCPEPLAWALVRRGLGDPAAAREFIAADGPLDPPEAIAGIAAAADRVLRAVARGERIAVHGDYDCDGVCSTAVLVRAVRAAGGEVVPFLPSRFTDGYGVRVETVERLAGDGVRLLVCVDCGTTAVDALVRAHDLGLDTVVCDHHLAAGVRPPGIVANPALGRPRDDAPAAVGVVFALVRAMAERADGGLLGPDPEAEIDLVALATVADAVPLVGQNRRLVARGLARMREAPRPGIRALCRAAGIDPRTLDARHLGYSLGPSINAAGRLTHAGEALSLVLATDEDEAMPLAERLWALNVERRDVERRITDEALAQVEAMPDEFREAQALVVAGDGWHEGVVGIVASRLVDRFDRPAIVITRDGDAAKGSGRSLPGVDLHDLVGRADGTLTRWGGHAGAVGLQLPAAAVARFRDELLAAAEGLRASIERARVRPVDAVVGARELTLPTAEALQALAPFGRGNPAVRLLMPGCRTESVGTVGAGRHLSLRLVCGGAHARAVGFGHGHRAGRLGELERVDAHVSLGVERYQDLVGPKVVVERLEAMRRGASVPGACAAAACDRACRARHDGAALRDAVLAGGWPEPPEPPAAAGPPLSVHDHRGTASGMSRIAALCGADGGVAVVVADAARRRAALRDVLAPGRLGVERTALGGARCAPAPLAERVAACAGRPALMMLDYDALAHVTLPDDVHVLALDPPAAPGEAAWLRAHGAGRHLHLAWSEEETGLARAAAEERAALRPVAALLWRALRDGGPRSWDDVADLLAGDGPSVRHPALVADALVALTEIGVVAVSSG